MSIAAGSSVESTGYKVRFYEKEPGVKFAVELMLAFPENMQSILGRGMSWMAEREYRAGELMHNMKSLGQDTVLALHQGQKKRRSYDRIPTVHRAMTYLRVLPPESQRALAGKSVELMGLLQEYLKDCRRLRLTPEKALIDKMTDVYVQYGAMSAQSFLASIQHDSQRSIAARDDQRVVLQHEHEGLRLKTERDS